METVNGGVDPMEGGVVFCCFYFSKLEGEGNSKLEEEEEEEEEKEEEEEEREQVSQKKPWKIVGCLIYSFT